MVILKRVLVAILEHIRSICIKKIITQLYTTETKMDTTLQLDAIALHHTLQKLNPDITGAVGLLFATRLQDHL